MKYVATYMQVIMHFSCEVDKCENKDGLETFNSSHYTCLNDNEEHSFCNKHKWPIRCPIHPTGSKRCEVANCLNGARKYFSHTNYTCLNAGEYHRFGDTHSQMKDCPIHHTGRRRREVSSCLLEANKYSRAYYSCLSVNKYHFFCENHARNTNCPIHRYGYRK